MNTYFGTKMIQARPMNRFDYNIYRGWKLPEDENGADEGYLVEYLDGGKANHPDHMGYVSWSPSEQFENSYRPTNAMLMGHAIEAMRAGHKVARAGWNGKGMFLFAVVGINGMSHVVDNIGEPKGLYPFVMMFTADEMLVPWLCSQADLFAQDWQIV